MIEFERSNKMESIGQVAARLIEKLERAQRVGEQERKSCDSPSDELGPPAFPD